MENIELCWQGMQSVLKRFRLSTAWMLNIIAVGLLIQSLSAYAIYQGLPVVKGDLPYVVSLQDIREGNTIVGHTCTGSLIAPRFVLTAAHCLESYGKLDYRVLVKVNNLETELGLFFDIKHIIPHPNYHSDTSDGGILGSVNDILLIELTEPVDLPLVNLAPFPLDHYVPPGASLTGTGWGVTDNSNTRSTFLKKAQIELLSDQESLQFWPKKSDSQFGTKGIDGNACKGDSGGPVLLMEQEQLIQVGIYKAAFGQCSQVLSVATRVEHHLEWIEKEQRLSFPRTDVIDTAIVGQAQQHRIEIKNNYHENLPLNDFSFSAVEQTALIGEVDVLTDTCSGQSLDPEQTCAIDISVTLAESGYAKIAFSSPTSSEVYPAITGLLEYRAVDVEDVSTLIHQGINSEKLTFKGNFAENWQVRNANNSTNGVVAALPLNYRDYANLIVEVVGKGKITIKFAMEKLLSSSEDSQLWFTLNNKMVPISVANHFVHKGATDGFISIEIPITADQSQLVLHQWSLSNNSTLLLEQFDFVADALPEPEPIPKPEPEPEKSQSSGGSSGHLILLLTLTILIFRFNKV